MKIAVDFDSTLAATQPLFLKLLEWKTGEHHDPEEITTWTWAEEHGYGKDFWSFYDLLDSTHLRRAIQPVDPMACGSVKWLVKRGHEVRILTSNHPKSEASIRSWLFGHGLELPLDIIGRKSPSEKAHLDFDVFIDDAPALAEAMPEVLSKRLYLVPQPWNSRVIPTDNVITDFSWRRALDTFERDGL